MSDTTSTEATTESTEETTTTPVETAEETTTETQKVDEVKGESEDELPEWARKRLSKANGEAAKYRASLREAEAKLAGAKTPEELEAAVAEFKNRNAELERTLLISDTARKFDLPDDLRDVLKGATQEELEAHAKVLQKYSNGGSGKTPANLSGGLDPNEDDDAFDPVKLARETRQRRY